MMVERSKEKSTMFMMWWINVVASSFNGPCSESGKRLKKIARPDMVVSA